MTQFSKTSCCLSNGQLCGKRTLPLANATPCPLAWTRYMYLNTLCNTPYFWWVSLFRNGRLILHCQLPQLVKADCRSTWKEATKILGVHRRNLATCGPVVKEQAYLAMSIHCVNMAPLPGLHTHRTISAVPWYQTLSEGCPIWQYFSWSRQATASLCVIWVSMQHPFWF